jgi:hypothetical protein
MRMNLYPNTVKNVDLKTITLNRIMYLIKSEKAPEGEFQSNSLMCAPVSSMPSWDQSKNAACLNASTRALCIMHSGTSCAAN